MRSVNLDPSSFETPWDRMPEPDPEIEKLEVRIWELERDLREERERVKKLRSFVARKTWCLGKFGKKEALDLMIETTNPPKP